MTMTSYQIHTPRNASSFIDELVKLRKKQPCYANRTNIMQPTDVLMYIESNVEMTFEPDPYSRIQDPMDILVIDSTKWYKCYNNGEYIKEFGICWSSKCPG